MSRGGVLFVRLNYYLAERKGVPVAFDLIIGVSCIMGFASRVFQGILEITGRYELKV
jgi:hypothetical protein